jgi:phage baseplate assembly protein W
MDKEEKSFLGQGWAFPPGFSLETKTSVLVSEEEDIQQSLIILLSTRLGERIMQPQYGCNLHTVVFEKADKSTITYLRDTIESAILYHEPRIKLIEIRAGVEPDQKERIFIDIIYLVRATNTRSNLVYPFSLTEATDLYFS